VDHYNKDLCTLYRIINGYYYVDIGNITYKVVLPSTSILYEAEIFASRIYNDYKYSTDFVSNIDQILLKTNMWNKEKEDQLTNNLQTLDNFKIDLYLNYFKEESKKQIKKEIDNMQNSINTLLQAKHSLDYLTFNYFIDISKQQFLLTKMIFKLDNSPRFNDYNDVLDSNSIDSFLHAIADETLTTNTIRQLARHDTWRSLWNVSKENTFNKNILEWTDEQKSLVNFTKMLDSIREHMESPAEEIFKDDDAIDGWILHQNKKDQAEKSKKLLEEKFDLNNKKAGEVFVITKDKAEKSKIVSLNDIEAKQNIKEVIKITKESDKNVNWVDLPHVQRELKQQIQKGKPNG
jgi:hypothetical protein